MYVPFQFANRQCNELLVNGNAVWLDAPGKKNGGGSSKRVAAELDLGFGESKQTLNQVRNVHNSCIGLDYAGGVFLRVQHLTNLQLPASLATPLALFPTTECSWCSCLPLECLLLFFLPCYDQVGFDLILTKGAILPLSSCTKFNVKWWPETEQGTIEDSI